MIHKIRLSPLHYLVYSKAIKVNNFSVLCLPRSNEYYKAKNKVSCSRTQQSRTRDPLYYELSPVLVCKERSFAVKGLSIFKFYAGQGPSYISVNQSTESTDGDGCI